MPAPEVFLTPSRMMLLSMKRKSLVLERASSDFVGVSAKTENTVWRTRMVGTRRSFIENIRQVGFR